MVKIPRLLISSAIFLIVLVVVFTISAYLVFTTDLWRKLPEGARVQVAFTKLELLSYDPYQHEDILLETSLYKEMISDFLIREPGIMGEQIKRYLNADEKDVNTQMKVYLVEIAKKAEEEKKLDDNDYEMKIPDYLVEYLNTPNVDLDAKRQILASFDQQLGASSWVVDGLMEVIGSEDKSIDERIPAIWDLANIASDADENGEPKYGNINYIELCDLLIDVAENKQNDDKLRNAAIDKMYACTKFPENYTEELFERVKKIFEDKSEQLGIRDSALTQLKTYDDISTSTTREYMDKVYNDKNEHPYLILGIHSFFDYRGIDGYKEPDMTLEEASEYANESGRVGYIRKSY